MTDFSDSFSILYQDDHIVAIHKPAGLLVHRSWMASNESQFALQMTRDAIGKKVFPVHRLDKPTSGVLIFALSSELARLLQQQFHNDTNENKPIEKEYLALVRGWPKQRQWVIDKPLKYHVDKFSEPGAIYLIKLCYVF